MSRDFCGPWGHEQIVVESKAKLRLFTFIVNLLRFPFCFCLLSSRYSGCLNQKHKAKAATSVREKEKQKHQVDGCFRFEVLIFVNEQEKKPRNSYNRWLGQIKRKLMKFRNFFFSVKKVLHSARLRQVFLLFLKKKSVLNCFCFVNFVFGSEHSFFSDLVHCSYYMCLLHVENLWNKQCFESICWRHLLFFEHKLNYNFPVVTIWFVVVPKVQLCVLWLCVIRLML